MYGSSCLGIQLNQAFNQSHGLKPPAQKIVYHPFIQRGSSLVLQTHLDKRSVLHLS